MQEADLSSELKYGFRFPAICVWHTAPLETRLGQFYMERADNLWPDPIPVLKEISITGFFFWDTNRQGSY